MYIAIASYSFNYLLWTLCCWIFGAKIHWAGWWAICMDEKLITAVELAMPILDNILCMCIRIWTCHNYYDIHSGCYSLTILQTTFVPGSTVHVRWAGSSHTLHRLQFTGFITLASPVVQFTGRLTKCLSCSIIHFTGRASTTWNTSARVVGTYRGMR